MRPGRRRVRKNRIDEWRIFFFLVLRGIQTNSLFQRLDSFAHRVFADTQRLDLGRFHVL
jgi:hypothetical protein